MKHIFYIFALLFLVACSEKIDNSNNNESEEIDYTTTNSEQWNITEQKIAANCEFDEQEVLGRLQMEGLWSAKDIFFGCDNGEYGVNGRLLRDGGIFLVFEFGQDGFCKEYSEGDDPSCVPLFTRHRWGYDHATRTLTTCTAQAIVRSVSDTEIILDGGLCGFECGYGREWEGDPTKKIYYPDHGIFYRFVLTFNSDKSYWEDAVEFNEHIE